MSEHSTGQLTHDAAGFYEEHFVPVLFKQRTGPLLDVAGISPGETVLDVGCGTGILARDAWQRMQRRGSVCGVDCNEAMIHHARALAPDIEWRVGRAERLPFDDARFDQVLSQFALMFFEDRVESLAGMWRVIRPGGRLTVAVWDSLENTPGYAAMTRLYERLFGPEIAGELTTPYCLGDRESLLDLFASAGITGTRLTTCEGVVRFASLKDWVDLDVKGWTVGELIGRDGYERLLAAVGPALQDFVQPDGSVVFSSPSHIVTAVRDRPG